MPNGPSQLTINAKELLSWTPDIDARRAQKPQIITGNNFIDDIDGPRSAFSSQPTNYNQFDALSRVKICELKLQSGGSLYGTPTGVYAIDPNNGVLIPILLVTTTNTYWPWTIAYVGGLYYLAQYDIGLWQYDPINRTIEHVDHPDGDSIRFVAAGFGRLVGFSNVNIFVSALDDGTNLAPSLQTAAQAQNLDIVGGTPYRIEVIPDSFLVFFNQGICKATYTTQAYVFQFVNLTQGIRVTNPNASVYIPRVGALSLDNSGFNLTREFNYTDLGIPQPWEIEKGDYIKKNILNSLDNTLFGGIQMYYSINDQLLFVSFASNTNQGLFTNTFVYSTLVKKWGSFNHQHCGIFEVYNLSSNTWSSGYMDPNGYMRAFTSANFSYDLPEAPFQTQDFLWRPMSEQQLTGVRNASDVPYYLGVCEINLSQRNPHFLTQAVVTGFYQINFTPYSDTSIGFNNDPAISGTAPFLGATNVNFVTSGGINLYSIPYALPMIDIASSISIGPFVFEDQIFADETSSVDTIKLDLTQTSGFTVVEDWNGLTGTEDYNAETGSEDWGSGVQGPDTFSLTLRSSNDGVNLPLQGDENLPVFADLGSTQIFKPDGWSALYHVLTLSTENAGDAWAIKTVAMTGLVTGRLQAE